MTRIIKVWIEADRLIARWQAFYRDHQKIRDKTEKEIINELLKHDEAQGMFVLNHLLSKGGRLLATHTATTGGVCTGIVALVEVEK